jgi:RNA polymerase sigma-70 factor, ECF subfamily
MEHLAESLERSGNGRPSRGMMSSSPDDDFQLCEKLKTYLEYRFENVDPPAPLSEAWDRFYNLYTPRFDGFLRKSGLTEAEREDCLQDVWSAVVVHLARLSYDSGRARLSTWLMTLVRNQAMDTLRRRRRSAAPISMTADPIDPGLGPLAACEILGTRALVSSVLGELSNQVSAVNFQVLTQRAMDGRTSLEVANNLGLTPEQVRFRLHRMKRKFRELFERSGAFPLANDELHRRVNGRDISKRAQQNGPSCV